MRHKYNLSEHEDIMTAIRQAEQNFHNKYFPVYALLFEGNSKVMGKIGDWIKNCPEGTILPCVFCENPKTKEQVKVDVNKKLSDSELTCGLELIDGKIDFDKNFQIAKHSNNAFIWALESINEEEECLILVINESLPDNIFVLDSDDDDDNDDTEILSPLDSDDDDIDVVLPGDEEFFLKNVWPQFRS